MAYKTPPNALVRLWLSFRSLLFWLVFIHSVLLFSLGLLVFSWASFRFRIRLINLWICLNLWVLRLTCGLRYEIEGLENIPSQGSFIFMSKHSSTWETIALQYHLPPLVWVVKQELMKIPLFGWGLRVQKAIPLQRGSGRKAVDKLLEHAQNRLQQGLSIMIFPEGTRVAAGEVRAYKNGGLILAQSSSTPIIPIAHNAGEFWPRHSWIKWPGTIKVRVGAPIQTVGKEIETLKQEVRDWIESHTEQLSDAQQRQLLEQLKPARD